MNTLDYSVIENNSDRKAKRIALTVVLGQSAKHFNEFVRSSIRFFYGEGNKQINIINDLLGMAHHAKGMNANKLADYLAACIPHELVAGNSELPPRFAKKTSAYEETRSLAFIKYNLAWWSYIPPTKEKAVKPAFDSNKYLSNVTKKLSKELTRAELKAFATELYNMATLNEDDRKEAILKLVA